MDNKSIEIIVQVAYKAQAEKAEIIDFTQVENDAREMIKIVNSLGGMVEPFASRPAGTQKGQKYVGMPCPECNTPMIQGMKGPYCRPCYVTWKEKQKNTYGV